MRRSSMVGQTIQFCVQSNNGHTSLIGSGHIKEQQRTHKSARFGAMIDVSR
jgi:hypothetical protein